jgi:hypothetical protein
MRGDPVQEDRNRGPPFFAPCFVAIAFFLSPLITLTYKVFFLGLLKVPLPSANHMILDLVFFFQP